MSTCAVGRLCLAFTLLVVAGGCGLDASSGEGMGAGSLKRHPITYDWIEYESQEPADDIPGHTWVTLRKYPLFKSDETGLNLDPINAHLHSLSRESDCDDKGERSFVMNVEHVDSRLLSLSYDDMWECPPMPRLSNRSGVVNFDPRTGAHVDFMDDVLPDRRSELNDHVASLMRETGGEELSCRGITSYYGAFRRSDEIVFSASPVEPQFGDCHYALPLSKVRPYLSPDSLFAVPAQP